MHENQDISCTSWSTGQDRSAKAINRTADVNAQEKSDCAVVPVHQPNNEGQPSAEAGEGRAQIEENIVQSHMRPTQSGKRMSQGLDGVRKAARENKEIRFTALLHHLTIELLQDSFYALQRKASPGVDGVTWQGYETGLEDRLVDLHRRVHRGAYRAQPSRRVYIPKADGRQRPLGIAALEDKIVQQAVVTILHQIYEVDFKGFSYGFRPGRSPHQALDALTAGIQWKRVNWVLDADIRGFFDNMSHEWIMKFIAHRVADPRILRLIQKWLKAGVSEDGQWSETKVGTPQGAVVSPLLANVYLHYVFDLWAEVWRKKVAKGDVIVVRYADDLVVGFQYRTDAERFSQAFRERLAKFGLELHADKTRLIEFGRFAARNRKQRGEGKPETFTFLGFTHFCGQRISDKAFILTLLVVLHVPVSLDLSRGNLLHLAAMYLTSAVPFFFTGLIFSVVFAREARQVTRLYGADLLGGAVACLAVVPLLNWLGGPNALLFAAFTSGVAAMVLSLIHISEPTRLGMI